MPIDNPTSLVEEFKKSGEFDRLRREVLTRFQQDGSYSALKTRVEEIGRQRLTTDQTLQYLPQETVQKELAQEVERYPIVERAVADVRIFSDPTFLANMQSSIQKILHDEPRGQSSMHKEIGSGTISEENTTKPAENAQDVKLLAESVRVSSSDTVLDKISTLPERPSGEDKAEPADSTSSNKGSVEPHNASEPPSKPPSSASTSKPNLVAHDSHAMEVDPPVD